jgi:hypothetical protein
MFKTMLLFPATLMSVLAGCEKIACVEPRQQPLEQIWQNNNPVFWNQIANGELAFSRDSETGGHLVFTRKSGKACIGKSMPMREVSELFERQSQALDSGIQDPKQMCQLQIELTRGRRFKDIFTYREVLFASGLRLTDVSGGEYTQQASVTLNIDAAEKCDSLFLVVSRLVPGRRIYENAGLRPAIVEMIDPSTVPEGQVVYGPGSR